MFGLIMPWTKRRLAKEAEEKRLADERLDMLAQAAKAKVAQMDASRKKYYDNSRAGVSGLSIAATRDQEQKLMAATRKRKESELSEQNAYQQAQRPGYVSDYTNSDSDALVMFMAENARPSTYDSSPCSTEPSRESSSSSSSDSGSYSSSDSGCASGGGGSSGGFD